MIDIAMSSLGNQELFTLGGRVNDTIGKYDAAALGFQLYAERFSTAFQAYKASFEKEPVSAEEVSQKDELRDNYYKALRSHVRNYRFHPDPDMVRKSKELVAILNMKGKRVYAEGYKVETAALVAILARIEKEALPIVQELGATMWYDFLKQAQTDFEASIHDHTEEKAESNKVVSATKNRAGLIDAITKLFTFLPLHYEMTGDENLGRLIDQLQEEADRF